MFGEEWLKAGGPGQPSVEFTLQHPTYQRLIQSNPHLYISSIQAVYSQNIHLQHRWQRWSVWLKIDVWLAKARRNKSDTKTKPSQLTIWIYGCPSGPKQTLTKAGYFLWMVAGIWSCSQVSVKPVFVFSEYGAADEGELKKPEPFALKNQLLSQSCLLFVSALQCLNLLL